MTVSEARTAGYAFYGVLDMSGEALSLDEFEANAEAGEHCAETHLYAIDPIFPTITADRVKEAIVDLFYFDTHAMDSLNAYHLAIQGEDIQPLVDRCNKLVEEQTEGAIPLAKIILLPDPQ